MGGVSFKRRKRRCNAITLCQYWALQVLSSGLSPGAPSQYSVVALQENDDPNFPPIAAASESEISHYFHCSLLHHDGSVSCNLILHQGSSGTKHWDLRFCDDSPDGAFCVTGHVSRHALTEDGMPKTIRVGPRLSFWEPFEQYDPYLANHLLLHQAPFANVFDESEWLIELAKAYQGEWEDHLDDVLLDAEQVRVFEGKFLVPAMESLLQVVLLLNGVVDDPNALHPEAMKAMLRIAQVYVDLSELSSKFRLSGQPAKTLQFMLLAEQQYSDASSNLLAVTNGDGEWQLSTSRDALVSQALTSVRVGVLFLDFPLDQDDDLAPISAAVRANVELSSRETSTTEIDPKAHRAALAEVYYQKAISVYRQILEDDASLEEMGDVEKRLICYDYAIALDNLSAAAYMRGDYAGSVRAADDSVRWYHDVLRSLLDDEFDYTVDEIRPLVHDVTAAMADLVFRVSDAYRDAQAVSQLTSDRTDLPAA